MVSETLWALQHSDVYNSCSNAQIWFAPEGSGTSKSPGCQDIQSRLKSAPCCPLTDMRHFLTCSILTHHKHVSVWAWTSCGALTHPPYQTVSSHSCKHCDYSWRDATSAALGDSGSHHCDGNQWLSISWDIYGVSFIN